MQEWLRQVIMGCLVYAGIHAVSRVMVFVVFKLCRWNYEPLPAIFTHQVDEESGLLIPVHVASPRSTFNWRLFSSEFVHELSTVSSSARSSGTAQQAQVSIMFDFSYMRHFYKLPQRTVNQVLQALQKAPIAEILFQWPPEDDSQYSRWLQLCRTLGTMPSIKRATLHVVPDDYRSAAVALQELGQLTHLTLFRGGIDREARQTDPGNRLLAKALDGHHHLQSVRFGLGPVSWAEILSVLRRITSMKDFYIHCCKTDSLSADNARAWAQCFADWQLDSLTLLDMHMDDKEACDSLCAGIAKLRAKKLHLNNVLIVDPTFLANSIALLQENPAMICRHECVDAVSSPSVPRLLMRRKKKLHVL